MTCSSCRLATGEQSKAVQPVIQALVSLLAIQDIAGLPGRQCETSAVCIYGAIKN